VSHAREGKPTRQPLDVGLLRASAVGTGRIGFATCGPQPPPGPGIDQLVPFQEPGEISCFVAHTAGPLWVVGRMRPGTWWPPALVREAYLGWGGGGVGGVGWWGGGGGVWGGLVVGWWCGPGERPRGNCRAAPHTSFRGYAPQYVVARTDSSVAVRAGSSGNMPTARIANPGWLKSTGLAHGRPRKQHRIGPLAECRSWVDA